MKIIPAIDLMDGKCVRLTQGKKESAEVFFPNPADAALRWQKEGAELLHVVDLDGAFTGEVSNHEALKQILAVASIPVQFGGGVRNLETLAECFELGASRVVLGTRAVKDRSFLEEACQQYPGKLLVALDACCGLITVEGWQEITGLSATDFVQSFKELPLAGIIYTDVVADGTMSSPNFEGVGKMAEQVALPLYVAGGISSLTHLALLKKIKGLAGAILGKALYTGAISLKQALALAASIPPSS